MFTLYTSQSFIWVMPNPDHPLNTSIEANQNLMFVPGKKGNTSTQKHSQSTSAHSQLSQSPTSPANTDDQPAHDHFNYCILFDRKKQQIVLIDQHSGLVLLDEYLYYIFGLTMQKDLISPFLTHSMLPVYPLPTANTQRREIYGIFGVHRLIRGLFLEVVTQIEAKMNIHGRTIYRIKQIDIITVSSNRPHEDLNRNHVLIDEETQNVALLRNALSSLSLHFSYNYDITLSIQKMYDFSQIQLQNAIKIEQQQTLTAKAPTTALSTTTSPSDSTSSPPQPSKLPYTRKKKISLKKLDDNSKKYKQTALDQIDAEEAEKMDQSGQTDNADMDTTLIQQQHEHGQSQPSKNVLTAVLDYPQFTYSQFTSQLLSRAEMDYFTNRSPVVILFTELMYSYQAILTEYIQSAIKTLQDRITSHGKGKITTHEEDIAALQRLQSIYIVSPATTAPLPFHTYPSVVSTFAIIASHSYINSTHTLTPVSQPASSTNTTLDSTTAQPEQYELTKQTAIIRMSRHNLGPRSVIRGINNNSQPGNFSQVEYISEIYRSCTTSMIKSLPTPPPPIGTHLNPLQFALVAISSYIVFRGSPPYPHRDTGGLLKPVLLSPITVEFIDNMTDMKELTVGQEHGVDVMDEQRNVTKIPQLTSQHCTNIIHANFHPHILENRILSLDNPFITPFVQQYVNRQLQEHFLPPQFLQGSPEYLSIASTNSSPLTPPKQITDTTTLQNEQFYSHLTSALKLNQNQTAVFPHFYEPSDNICDMVRSERERVLYALEAIKQSQSERGYKSQFYEELFSPSSEPLLRVVSLFGGYVKDKNGEKLNESAALMNFRDTTSAVSISPFSLLNYKVVVNGTSFDLNQRISYAIERSYKQHLTGPRIWKFRQHLLHYLPLPKHFLLQLGFGGQVVGNTPKSESDAQNPSPSQHQLIQHGNFIELINKNSLQHIAQKNHIQSIQNTTQQPDQVALPHLTFLTLPCAGSDHLTIAGIRHLLARDSCFFALVPSMLPHLNPNQQPALFELDPFNKHLCATHNMTMYLPTTTTLRNISTTASTQDAATASSPFSDFEDSRPLATHSTFFNTTAIEIQLFTPFPYHIPSQSLNSMILPNYQPPLQAQMYSSFNLLQVGRQISISRYNCMDSIDRSGKILSYLYPLFIELTNTYLNNFVQFSPVIFNTVIASGSYQKEVESIPYLIQLATYIREYFIMNSLGIEYHPQLHFEAPLSLTAITNQQPAETGLKTPPLPAQVVPYMNYQCYPAGQKVLQVLYDQNVQLMQQLARLVTGTFLLFRPSFPSYQAQLNKLPHLQHTHGTTNTSIIKGEEITPVITSPVPSSTNQTTSRLSTIPPLLHTTAHQSTCLKSMRNYFIYHIPTDADPLQQPSVYHYVQHQATNVSHLFFKDNFAGFTNLTTFNSHSYNLTLSRRQKQLELRNKAEGVGDKTMSPQPTIAIEPNLLQLSCALQQMAIINPHSLHCFANISPPIYHTPTQHTLEFHSKPAFPHIFLTNTSTPTVDPATITYDPITNQTNSIALLSSPFNPFTALIGFICAPLAFLMLQLAFLYQAISAHPYANHIKRRYIDAFDFSKTFQGLSILFTLYRPTRGLLPLQGFMVKQLPPPPVDPNQAQPQPPQPPRYGLFPIYENKLTPQEEMDHAYEQMVIQHEQEQSVVNNNGDNQHPRKAPPPQFSPQQRLRYQGLKAANPNAYNKSNNPYTKVTKWLPLIGALMTALIAFTFLWLGPQIITVPDLRNTSPLSPRFDDLHNSTLPTLLLAPPSQSYMNAVIADPAGPIPSHFSLQAQIDQQYHQLIHENGPSWANLFIHNTILSPYPGTPLAIQQCVIDQVYSALIKQRDEIQGLVAQLDKLNQFNNRHMVQGVPISAQTSKRDTAQYEAQLQQRKDHLTSGKHLIFSLHQHQHYGQIDFINLSLLQDTVLYRDCNVGSVMTPQVLDFIKMNTPKYTKITFAHYESLPTPQTFYIVPSSYPFYALFLTIVVPISLLTLGIHFALFDKIKDDLKIQRHWFTPTLEFSPQLHQLPRLQPPPPPPPPQQQQQQSPPPPPPPPQSQPDRSSQ